MCTSINSIVKDCPCTEAGKRYAAVESRYGLCSEVKVPKPVPECTPGEPLPPDPTSKDPVPDFKTSVTEQSSESTNPATEPIAAFTQSPRQVSVSSELPSSQASFDCWIPSPQKGMW